MNHWTIGDGELRRQVIVQAGRHDGLRRRSDEARLLEAARGPDSTLGERLRSWLMAALSRLGRSSAQECAGGVGLKHGRG